MARKKLPIGLQDFRKIIENDFKYVDKTERYSEKFFHAAIHLLFSYLVVRIHSEVCTSDGRIDSLVETDTHIYYPKVQTE